MPAGEGKVNPGFLSLQVADTGNEGALETKVGAAQRRRGEAGSLLIKTVRPPIDCLLIAR